MRRLQEIVQLLFKFLIRTIESDNANYLCQQRAKDNINFNITLPKGEIYDDKELSEKKLKLLIQKLEY